MTEVASLHPQSTRSTTARLLKIKYKDRSVMIPRPETFQATLGIVRRYFQLDTTQLVLETKSLEICDEEAVEISEDCWELVKDELRVLDPHERRFPRKGTETYYIETCMGKPLAIQAEPWFTVENFKRLIEEREGTPSEEQWLIFAGRAMQNKDTLSSSGLLHKSTVHLFKRLRGGKPVIYLQSPQEIHVTVKLSLVPSWSFSSIYPMVSVTPQGDGSQTLQWSIWTRKDGTLFDDHSGADIAYLYWEALSNPNQYNSPLPSPRTDQERFDPAWPVLTKDNSVLLDIAENLTGYLDEALLCLGLHVEARTSFITYWLPSFLKHKYVALRFINQAAYECAAPLEITPKPDVVTRVFMLFCGIPASNIEEWSSALQRSTESVQRWRKIVGVDKNKISDKSLFRVLEWGGMEVK